VELSYKIPCYGTYDNPDFGIYTPADGALGALMDTMLDRIRDGDVSNQDVPLLPGFVCAGRTMGQSYTLTVSKVADVDGELLDLPVPICTCHFATRDEDVAAVAQDAINELGTAGNTAPHPSFKFAMRHLPEAPFVTTISWVGANAAIENNILSVDEVVSCTGFFQTIIGNAASRAGLEGFKASTGEDWILSDMDLYIVTHEDICGAIQTGGALQSELIVEPGSDGYPQTYAYIIDKELDVFRVDFDHETMTFDAENASYLMLDSDILTEITDLHEEAKEIWEEVDTYEDEIDEAIYSDAGVGVAVEDPLAHLYTNHIPLEVNEDVASRLISTLGLSTHYSKSGKA
jgi:hypothetical protein